MLIKRITVTNKKGEVIYTTDQPEDRVIDVIEERHISGELEASDENTVTVTDVTDEKNAELIKMKKQALHPETKVVLGALIKAVLEGDKAELQSLKSQIDVIDSATPVGRIK